MTYSVVRHLRTIMEERAQDTPPEETPPYTYITEEYSETLGARFSGLPGYTPPTIVTALIRCKQLAAWGVIGSILALLSTLVFIDTLPFVPRSWHGLSLLTLPAAEGGVLFDLRVTAELICFLVFMAFACLLYAAEVLAIKLSHPYEEAYEGWLLDVQPPADMYPPYEYWWRCAQDESTEIERVEPYLPPVEDAPRTAPRPYRETRWTERVMDGVVAFLSVWTSLLLFTLAAQHNDPATQVAEEFMQSGQTQTQTVVAERREQFGAD